MARCSALEKIAQEAIEGSKQEIEKLDNEVKILKSKQLDFDKQIEKYTAEKKISNEEKQSLSGKLMELSEKTDTVGQQLLAAKAKIAELEKEVKDQSQTIQSLVEEKKKADQLRWDLYWENQRKEADAKMKEIRGKIQQLKECYEKQKVTPGSIVKGSAASAGILLVTVGTGAVVMLAKPTQFYEKFFTNNVSDPLHYLKMLSEGFEFYMDKDNYGMRHDCKPDDGIYYNCKENVEEAFERVKKYYAFLKPVGINI
jgi:hypothetical protein